ncbi:MAG: xanthine dehydrogenase family protein subunit M, partial [Acidimicrobiales bacterium]
ALGRGTPAPEAARWAADGTEPPTDIRATAEFRRHLAVVLCGRALAAAGW